MKVPFSNGTEAMAWLENNCDICWKGRNYVGSATMSDKNPYCKPCQEILESLITGEVSDRTYEIMNPYGRCKNYQEKRPSRKVAKKDKNSDVPSLF